MEGEKKDYVCRGVLNLSWLQSTWIVSLGSLLDSFSASTLIPLLDSQ